MSLTQHAVSMILGGSTIAQPVVQILDVKQIKAANSSTDRYRLIISDGQHFCQAMLATQLNALIVSQQMSVNSVIRLEDFVCNEVQSRKIVIVLHLEVIISNYDHKIGNPVSLEAGNANASNAPRPVQPSMGAQSVQQSYNPSPMAQKPHYQPQTNMQYGGNRAAPVVRHDSDAPRVANIAVLNPYQNRWTIKARVTAKSEVKRWANAKSEGKLCSIDLLDQSGEIRGTFFKEAVDKFYDLLVVGNLYYFSGGRLKVANPKFNNLKNEYEITFDTNSEIRPAPDDGGIAQMGYSFRKISELERMEANTAVDIIAVVKQVGDIASLTSKKGTELTKRDLTIVDDSGTEVRFTLWNEKAMQDPSIYENSAIIAIKGARVNDYNGRTLSSISSTAVMPNPDIPEAGSLRQWFDSTGAHTAAKSLSGSGASGGGGGNDSITERRTIASIKDDRLGFGDKPDYITIKGTINFIKHDTSNWYYTACEQCHKKVIQDLNMHFVCEKCNKTWDRADYRYILSVTANDHTGSTWMTAFNDQSLVLLDGKSANELAELQLANEAAYETVFQQSCFKTYLMRLRVKSEVVQDESRLKVSIVSISPVDYAKESKELLRAIEMYA